MGLEGTVLDKEGSADFFVAFACKDIVEYFFFFEGKLLESVLKGGFFVFFNRLELVNQDTYLGVFYPRPSEGDPKGGDHKQHQDIDGFIPFEFVCHFSEENVCSTHK